MITMRSRGPWLLVLGVATGLLDLAGLTAVALAATPDHSASLSTALPMPYAAVVEAVRAVCADGVIRGTAQYESEATIDGAKESASSALFPRWTGSGVAFYKTRPGAIAPSHFAGSKDRGAVTVRYVVAPGPAGDARVTIDAVFVEDTHHGRHPSQGFVEKAEFEEISKRLKNSGALGDRPALAVVEREPEQRKPAPALPAVAAVATATTTEVRSAPPRERTYARGENDLKKVLQDLGAFDDAALPVLEGFAALGADGPVGYDRPYYRFRVVFDDAGAGGTTVRLEAVVTARFTDPAGSRPEYRSVPSNGRLENDMLDRLDGYLRLAAGTSASGTAGPRQPAVSPTGNQ
jgi:hypothetical protein